MSCWERSAEERRRTGREADSIPKRMLRTRRLQNLGFSCGRSAEPPRGVSDLRYVTGVAGRPFVEVWGRATVAPPIQLQDP